jgi:phosphoglycerate dehydrogenase-like enzyme
MSSPRIVCSGPMDPVVGETLAPFGEVAVARERTEEALIELADGAVALIMNADAPASARVIEAAPDLRVVARTGVGYDNVDVAAATARRIPVIYTPGASAGAVAEAAVALMLVLCKGIFHWDRELKRGNWESRSGPKPRDLEGATLGIVGFGRIGRTVAERVRPFGMTVLASDPYADADRAAELDVQLVNLEELLRRSDFISLHAVVTEETRGMINRERLRLVKPGAYLINLARGAVVDGLDVLHEALQDGRLAGVGLDVFEPEPPDVSHPIFAHPGCVAAPHVLGSSARGMASIYASMLRDVVAVLEGRRPRFAVNPEVLDGA